MTRRILILDGHPDPATAQIQSSSYLLPVEDQTFLLRDAMRSVRFALEYAYAWTI